MKTITLSCAVAGLLLPGIVFAAPQDGPRHGRQDEGRKGGAAMRDGWKEADVDGDGKISRAEFQAMPRIQGLPEEKRENLFSRLDKDGDGFISSEERGGGMAGPRGRENPIQRLSDLDTDRSGGISIEEFRAGAVFKKLPAEKQDEMFKRLDTDGDGQLTPKDRPQPHWRNDGRGGGLRQFLNQAKVESLTFDEFSKMGQFKDLAPAELKERFDRMDRNRDGKLDSADLPSPPPERGGRPGPAGKD
jgi:Ca2+-binding EF-hand superfamily protein